MPSRRQKRSRVKVNFPLRFAHEVLDLDRLHYGLWEGEPLTREGLVAAQERYTERLIEWIPPGVETILDVGCGVGVDDLELSRRGFQVEGLSVDPYQQERYREIAGLPFHLTSFRDFQPRRTYDLVLMSESSQYIQIDDVFGKFLQAAPGGHLLVADYFVVSPPENGRRVSGHSLERFLGRAEELGLALERREDVTEQALPTLELATRWIDHYLDPSLRILEEWMAYRHPTLLKLGRGLFAARLARERAEMRRQVDPEEFARSKRYLLLLLRDPGTRSRRPAEV